MSRTIIGVGSFGFVVSSPIDYTSTSNSEFVGKIISPSTDKEDIENEWALSNALKEIDPDNEHFIYPIDKTLVSKTNIAVSVNDKLPWYFNMTDNKTFTQFIMKFGGISIRNYIKCNSLSTLQMIKYVLDTACGIKTLLDNNIIHCDLHLQNLVVKDDLCKIIDFNVSTDSSSFYHPDMLTWCSEYAISPCDTRICNEKYDILDEKHLLSLYIQVTPDILDFIFDSDVYITSFNRLVSVMKYQSYEQNVIFMKVCKSHKKVDIYALGVSLLEMYLNIKKERDIEYNICIIIEKLIILMLLPHPDERINICDLIHELEIMLFLTS